MPSVPQAIGPITLIILAQMTQSKHSTRQNSVARFQNVFNLTAFVTHQSIQSYCIDVNALGFRKDVASFCFLECYSLFCCKSLGWKALQESGPTDYVEIWKDEKEEE